MSTLAAIAVGGASGALARYGVDRFVEARADSLFPWATFVINVSGCFLAGLAIALVVERAHAPSWLGLGLTVGFLGAYTTFSTFAFESYELLELRRAALAAAYVTSSVLAGVAALAVAVALARR